MLILAVALGVSWLFLIVLHVSSTRERTTREASFSTEREIWVRERRDLNNRIQVPEAAPYLAEEDNPAAAKDDLPVLPEFTVDEEELERAQRELAAAGYEDGPAT